MNEKKYFSLKFFPLGCQWHEILKEMSGAGYTSSIEIALKFIESLAESESDKNNLFTYWCESAKERLAALVGPVDIISGTLPEYSAYRSNFLDNLRRNAQVRPANLNGLIDSPQIEPTIKKYVDMLPDSPKKIKMIGDVKIARINAVENLNLIDIFEFRKFNAKKRYDILHERYLNALHAIDFRLVLKKKDTFIFRKNIPNTNLDFVFLDNSFNGIDTGGLSPSLAIVKVGSLLKAGDAPLNSILYFSPKDIIPQFQFACGFSVDSYSEFCLAADSIVFFIKSLFEKITKIDFSDY